MVDLVKTALAADVGKGGCRVAWVHAGQSGPFGVGPGVPHISERGADQAIASAIYEAAAATGQKFGDIDTLCAGVTGLFEAMDRAPALVARLLDTFPVRQVVVTGDVVTSHSGALDGGEGVVIAVGTGTVALGVDWEGSFAKADGCGYILGDDGSGYSIGRQGLASALRHFDGRGGSSLLAAYAENQYGRLDQLADKIYATDNPPALVADFAGSVADAARQSDAEALRIWDEASSALARTTAAVAKRLFTDRFSPVTLSWTGELFNADDLLLRPFVERAVLMTPQLDPRPRIGDSLAGAIRLIKDGTDGIHRELLFVMRRSDDHGVPNHESRA